MAGAAIPFRASPPRGEVPRSGGGESRAGRIRARPSDIVHVPARTQDPGGQSRRAQIGDEMSRECTPTREESRALARDHALIPVYREALADMLTPVRAYSLLCPQDSPGFLLESVEVGERLARYSFLGYQPRQLALGDRDPLPAPP